jgi:hypothetical protein
VRDAASSALGRAAEEPWLADERMSTRRPGARRLSLALRVALAFALFAEPAESCVAAYQGTVEVSAASPAIRVVHRHDWGKRKSSIRLSRVDSGMLIAEKPSPPLTMLWVSPDSFYVEGLSDVKYDNPVQVLVMRTDGTVLFERSVTCRDSVVESPPCGESVSNWVYWYNKDRPDVHLEMENGRPAVLIVDAPIHRRCTGRKPHELNEEWRGLCSAEPEKLRIPLGE